MKAEAERLKADNLTLQAMIDACVSRSDANAGLRASLNRYVIPKLGRKPVRETTEIDIRDVLRVVGRAKGKNRTAVLLLADIRQLFRPAIDDRGARRHRPTQPART